MVRGNSYNYNFFAGSASAYGSNQIPVDLAPVRFAFYGGDVNHDRTVDLNDIILIC